MCPNIIEHDDEEANEEYFSKKMQRAPDQKAKTALEDLKMFGQFHNLGVSIETLMVLLTAGTRAIDEEPDEEQLLVSAIKNTTSEKKAKRDFE